MRGTFRIRRYINVILASILGAGAFVHLALAQRSVGSEPSVAQTYVIATEGALPGIAASDVAAYVARQMSRTYPAPRQFTPASRQTRSPLQVTWRFHLSPSAAGAVRYIGPGNAPKLPFLVRFRLVIDAQLMRNGMAEGEVTRTIFIKEGGPDSSVLADAIGATTRELMTGNADPAGRTSALE
jgi:hypothetical protein